MIEGLLFILAVFIVFYLPGRFVLRFTKQSIEDFPTYLSISLTIGIGLFLLCTYLLIWFKLDFFYNIFLLIPFIFFCKDIFSRSLVYPKIKKEDQFIYLLILIGSACMVYVTWFSGIATKNGMAFYSFNAVDSISHLSVIGNLTTTFPPTHPGLSGVPFRGYHIFYDFLISNFIKYYHFSIYDLFFRFFPSLIALFYGLSGLAVIRSLKANTFTSSIFILLLYFAQSIKFFLFTPFGINSAQYDSGISQGVGLIIDPSVVLSLIVLFTFFVIIQNKSHTKKTILISALLLGILPQVKIYTAIIVYLSFGTFATYQLIKKHQISYLALILVAAIISGVVYIPINFGSGSLVFAPLLLYKHFMESEGFLSGNTWILKYQVYMQHNNIIRLTQLYVIAFFYYFVPSLGIRLFSVFLFKKLLVKKFYSNEKLFLCSAIVFSILIPSFFIQSSGVFNIVQFLWIAYILLLIPTAFAIGKLSEKGVVVRSVIIILILLFLIPDNRDIAKQYSQNPFIVNNNLISISQSIASKIPQTSGLLVLPENGATGISNSPLISALSGHSVYFETEVLGFPNIDSAVNQRKNVILRLENDSIHCSSSSIQEINSLMQQTQNQYLLVLQKNACLQHDPSLSMIDSKGNYFLYKKI